jgi:ribosomal-protein-alanine N-acetyltransferase
MTNVVIETERMRIVQGGEEHSRAEIAERRVFEGLLGARVPPAWPPASLADALPGFLDLFRQLGPTPWLVWYGVLRSEGLLVASIGFKGPPAASQGAVEIGYSVLPAYQGRGFASELAGAMSAWALSQPGVLEVRATVDVGNTPSIRVLEKAGFLPQSVSLDSAMLHYVRSHTDKERSIRGRKAAGAGDQTPPTRGRATVRDR